MEGSDDPKDREEQSFEEFLEEMDKELPDDAHIMTAGSRGGQPEQEEWRDMMPDQKPGVASRIVGAIFKLAVLVLILAPAIRYYFAGFEAAVVAFMVVFLFFFAHLI